MFHSLLSGGECDTLASHLVRDIAWSGVEFLFLLLIWAIFVGNPTWQEFAIGVLAALAGAVGDAIVKREGLAAFRPRAGWVLLIFWEPAYVLKGTVLVFRELARTLGGRQPRGQFQAVPFRFGGQGEAAAGRRALFAAYTTISPDTIVVGMDAKNQIALLHQVGSGEVSELARRLGVKQ